MKIISTAACAVMSVILLSGCAWNSPGELAKQQAGAASALRRGFDPNQAAGDLAHAQLAGARDDWTVQVQLAQQSFNEKPDLYNQFNLAVGYEHTGRTDLAEPLYRDLVERGTLAPITQVRNFDGSLPGPLLATVALEAQARLDLINGRRAYVPTMRILE